MLYQHLPSLWLNLILVLIILFLFLFCKIFIFPSYFFHFTVSSPKVTPSSYIWFCSRSSVSLRLPLLVLYTFKFSLHARLLQSCPTLCNPMDCSPPSSSAHGILQARILEWLLCPPPGDLPNQGTKLASLLSRASAGGFFTISTVWETLQVPFLWSVLWISKFWYMLSILTFIFEHVLSENDFCLCLERIQMSLPKICHFVICFTLSWSQSKPRTLRVFIPC